MLDAFNPGEAIVRFRRALAADPHLAMAWWGIAFAYGPNINTGYDLDDAAKARDALAHAKALAAYASPQERAYVDALEPRYAARSTAAIPAAQQAFAGAARALARTYPDDLDAQTLAAEALMDLHPWDAWSADGTPAPGTLDALALLESVRRRDPQHIQAAHLYIHALEANPARLPAARSSADMLAALTFEPGAEHLAHMPAHVYFDLGDQERAIAASEAAVAGFHAYLAGPHAPGHEGYLVHDLEVLAFAAMMAGRYARAASAAAEASSRDADDPLAAYVAMRFRKWNDILAIAAPVHPLVTWQLARALAFASTGREAQARSALAALDAKAAASGQARIVTLLVDAAGARARADYPAAIVALRHAVAIEDGFGYAEPPDFFYPVRETLGGTLLLANRPGEARAVFEADLERNPHNGRSLFGLAAACAALDDPACASAARVDFARAWRGADVTLALGDL